MIALDCPLCGWGCFLSHDNDALFVADETEDCAGCGTALIVEVDVNGNASAVVDGSVGE